MTASVTAALNDLLSAQGRTARPGQVTAAARLDQDGAPQHVAFLAPTGSGKSLLAVAIGAAEKLDGRQTVITMHSNGLVAQYHQERAAHEATGLSVATLVGQRWYHCPKASPSLAGLSQEQRDAVEENDGFLLAAGIDPLVAVNHSIAALTDVDEDQPQTDEDGNEIAKPRTPCDGCEFKATGTCPLWNARRAAQVADVVITNTTMLGLKFLSEPDRTTLVLDEAHTAAEPLRSVLSPQVTIKLGRKNATEDEVLLAAGTKAGAMSVLSEWASKDEHPMSSKVRNFYGKAKGRFNEIAWRVEGDTDRDELRSIKVTLFVPADLRAILAPFKVVAMSGTLSQPVVDDLGLDATVEKLDGLDLSASSVKAVSHPAWNYGEIDAWAQATAQQVVDAFHNGCAALVLFVSGRDMEATVAALAARGEREVLASLINYSSKTDRVGAIRRYKADPKSSILIGFIQGAGVGVDLPGDLLRTVIITRVPQTAPRNADQAKWSRDSKAQVVQAAGRAHRFEEDWGNVLILGGFGRRSDVVAGLREVGWTV